MAGSADRPAAAGKAAASSTEIARLVSRGYDAVADRYAALEDDSWPRQRWLARLLDDLPAGARVLDLGCGGGAPADVLIARHHRVVGVDVSHEQLLRARRAVPSGAFVQVDITTLALAAGSFDAVVSFYALDHVPRDTHPDVLARVAGWLRPGGRLLFAVENGDVEGSVGTWLDVPMFFSLHPADVVCRLVINAGFRIDDSAVETQTEHDREIGYTWVLATWTGE